MATRRARYTQVIASRGSGRDRHDSALPRLLPGGLRVRPADQVVEEMALLRDRHAQLIHLANQASRVRIELGGYFTMGLPGESEQTMRRTVQFAVDSGLAWAQFTPFRFVPGSVLADREDEFCPRCPAESLTHPPCGPRTGSFAPRSSAGGPSRGASIGGTPFVWWGGPTTRWCAGRWGEILALSRILSRNTLITAIRAPAPGWTPARRR